MGVASGCGEQEAVVASRSGWNLWVWLVRVFVRRYIDFIILLIPTALVSFFFVYSSIPNFYSFLKCFRSCIYIYIYISKIQAFEVTRKLASPAIIIHN